MKDESIPCRVLLVPQMHRIFLNNEVIHHTDTPLGFWKPFCVRTPFHADRRWMTGSGWWVTFKIQQLIPETFPCGWMMDLSPITFQHGKDSGIRSMLHFLHNPSPWICHPSTWKNALRLVQGDGMQVIGCRWWILLFHACRLITWTYDAEWSFTKIFRGYYSV